MDNLPEERSSKSIEELACAACKCREALVLCIWSNVAVGSGPRPSGTDAKLASWLQQASLAASLHCVCSQPHCIELIALHSMLRCAVLT